MAPLLLLMTITPLLTTETNTTPIINDLTSSVTTTHDSTPAVINPTPIGEEASMSSTTVDKFILKVPPEFFDFLEDIQKFDILKLVNEYLERKFGNGQEIYDKNILIEIIMIDLFNSMEFYIPRWFWTKLFRRVQTDGFQHFTERDLARIMLRIENSNTIFERSTRLNLSGFVLNSIPAKELSLFKNVTSLNLEDTSVRAGYEDLRIMKKLRFLNIRRNGITIFPDFRGFPELVCVDASWNYFGHLDFASNIATDFVNGEVEPSKISRLVLCDSGIVGISGLFMAFPDLEMMCICGNKIVETRAEWVKDAVRGSVCVSLSFHQSIIGHCVSHPRASARKVDCYTKFSRFFSRAY